MLRGFDLEKITTEFAKALIRLCEKLPNKEAGIKPLIREVEELENILVSNITKSK